MSNKKIHINFGLNTKFPENMFKLLEIFQKLKTNCEHELNINSLDLCG